MTNHYGKPLTVRVVGGKLVIEIGIHTLAHAVSYADWANRWDGVDYVRTFAISDSVQFAEDVAYAMQREAEDGSMPLSDFLDKMAEAALDDGSIGVEHDQRITNGSFSTVETWAQTEDQ